MARYIWVRQRQHAERTCIRPHRSHRRRFLLESRRSALLRATPADMDPARTFVRAGRAPIAAPEADADAACRRRITIFHRRIRLFQPRPNFFSRLRRKIYEAQSAHYSGLIGPHNFRVASDATSTIDLKSEARFAAFHRRDCLKAAALFGEIQHDAAVLAPQLQIHQLLGAPANDRAFILFHRFDFHVYLSDLTDCAEQGEKTRTLGGTVRCTLAFYPRRMVLTSLIFSPQGVMGDISSRLWKSKGPFSCGLMRDIRAATASLDTRRNFEQSLSFLTLTRGSIESFGSVVGNTGFRGRC